MKSALRTATSLLIGLVAAPALAAPPSNLATLLPRGSLLSVQWSGHDMWGAAVDATAVGKTLAEPDVRAFVDLAVRESADALRRRMVQQGGVLGQIGEPLIQFGGTLWRRPWAVVLVEADQSVQLGFILQPGAETPAVRQLVDRFTSLARKSGAPIKPLGESAAQSNWSTIRTAPDSPLLAWCFSDDVFALAVGESAAQSLSASLAGESHLLDQPDYKAVVEGLAASPSGQIVSVFADTNRLQKMAGRADAGVQMLSSLLGVDGVTAIGGSIGLADGGYRSAIFMRTPGARRGLLQLFDQPAVQDDALLVVPNDALFAYVSNCNLAALFGGDSSASQPAAGLPVNPLMFIPETREAAPAVQALLSSIGNTWTLWLSPDAGGIFLSGLTACVPVKDEDAARRALARIVEAIDKELGNGELRVRKSRMQSHDVNYVYANQHPSPFAPAWGFAKGKLVIALYPQNVAATLTRLEAGTPRDASILANTGFAAGRKLLPAEANSLAYYDTANAMGRLYDVALPALQVLFSSQPAGTGKLDIAAVPSRASIMQHLFPSMSATRSNANGVLMVSSSSLPIVNPSIAEALVLAPVIGGLTMPMMSRAEAAVDRRASMTRLKELGMASQMYASEHNDQFPSSLDELKPLMDKAGNLSSFRLLTGLPPLPQITHVAERVLIYEDPKLYKGAGTCVLYADGHVQWRAMQAFQSDLESTQRYLAEAAASQKSR